MAEFFQRLRERKLVQWTLAYIAAAFALIQVTDVVAQQFDWPGSMRRGVTIILAVGFFVTLVLAWYHGEKGAQRVSGTELLIVAVLLALGGGVLWRLAPKAADAAHNAPKAASVAVAADRKSIAVMPFANLSSDKENNYFADGIRDMILTKLAGIGDLKVISRTSTDKYGDHPEDLKAVALQLGVASVLEGSVQKSGNQVLINLQLISASNDQHLWAEAYKRTIDDIFGVEGEVAQTVAEALNAKLSSDEQKSFAEKPTTSAEAFDLFLRAEHARYEADRTSNYPGYNEAVALYEQAVAKDPKFALAWARMSAARSALYWGGNFDRTSMQETARLALRNAEQAVALQPTLPEANLAMGFYQYYVRLDLAQALVSFETALRARPNDAPVLHALGLILRRLSRFDEAIDHLEAANRIDPRNQVVSNSLLATQVLARHYSDAARTAEQKLALDPSDENALEIAAIMKVALHDDLEGAQDRLRGAPPGDQVVRADLLRLMGRFAEAIELVKALPDSPETFESGPVDTKSRLLGTLYLESGDVAAARPLLLDAREKIAAASAQVPEDHPSAADIRLRLAYVDALLGDSAAAVELTRQALLVPAIQRDKNYLGWVDVAGAATRVYARARRPDLAVPLLEILLASPGSGYVMPYAELRLDPDFAPIRSDPAFQALMTAHPGSGDVRK
jgi:TolB-like protein/Flp pilus assembly protein TadD